MAETFYLVLAFAAGIALGTFYFLNLWKTVQRISEPSGPGLFMVRNFVFRLAVVLPGFYLVMAGHWERLLMAMLGFVIMREILVRRIGRGPERNMR